MCKILSEGNSIVFSITSVFAQNRAICFKRQYLKKGLERKFVCMQKKQLFYNISITLKLFFVAKKIFHTFDLFVIVSSYLVNLRLDYKVSNVMLMALIIRTSSVGKNYYLNDCYQTDTSIEYFLESNKFLVVLRRRVVTYFKLPYQHSKYLAEIRPTFV